MPRSPAAIHQAGHADAKLPAGCRCRRENLKAFFFFADKPVPPAEKKADGTEAPAQKETIRESPERKSWWWATPALSPMILLPSLTTTRSSFSIWLTGFTLGEQLIGIRSRGATDRPSGKPRNIRKHSSNPLTCSGPLGAGPLRHRALLCEKEKKEERGGAVGGEKRVRGSGFGVRGSGVRGQGSGSRRQGNLLSQIAHQNLSSSVKML